MFNTIHPDQLNPSSARNNYFLVDLRSQHQFQNDGIAGSKHMPFHSLPEQYNQLPLEKEIVLICDDGKMAAAARNFLMGYAKLNNVVALEFGVQELHKKFEKRKAS